MLAALKMAVDDINSGRYLRLSADALLPNTKILVSVRTSPPTYTDTVLTVNNIITTAFNGTGIDVAIGDLQDVVTENIASIFQEANIAQVAYNPGIQYLYLLVPISALLNNISQNFDLIGAQTSHNDIYYDMVCIAPSTSFEGKVIADLLTYTFMWARVAVVYTSDDLDLSDLFFEFTERAKTNNITILESLPYSKATTDFSSLIIKALPMEPQIILLIMKPENGAPFLEQAYSLGLITLGVTVLGTSFTSDPGIYSSFSPSAPIKSILKGYIGVSEQM